MSGLEWSSSIIDEYEDINLCKRVSLNGDVLGYYVSCKRHGCFMDVTLEQGKMMSRTTEFCPDCLSGKPAKSYYEKGKRVQKE